MSNIEAIAKALDTVKDHVSAAEIIAKLHVELATATARAEAAEREREQLRGKFHAANAESTKLLELAYNVCRDAGGKIGANSIYSFGEWKLWLPTQTDDALLGEVQP